MSALAAATKSSSKLQTCRNEVPSMAIVGYALVYVEVFETGYIVAKVNRVKKVGLQSVALLNWD